MPNHISRTLLSVAAVATLSMSLVACSSSNKGGETTCGSFKSMSTSDQKAVISTFEKSKGTDPSALSIDATWVSAKAYCFVKPGDAAISGIDG